MESVEANPIPTVSVIIPPYKTAHLIAECLDSVLAQTYKDFEIIVVNGGSPDTPELEKALLPYWELIRYTREENRGPGGARNTAIRHARGEFLAFLDSDDVWLPDFLAEQLKFFKEHPGLDLACADCVYFGNTSLAGKSWQSLYPVAGPVTFEKILPTHGGAFASNVMLRRETVVKVGFFVEQDLLEDYQYWLRLLYSGGKMAYLPKVLGKRRVHSASATYDHDVVVPNAIKVLQKLAPTLDPARKESALVRDEIARAQSQLATEDGKQSLAEGDFKAALRSFEKAYSVLPSRKIHLVFLGLRWAPRLTRRVVGRWERHLNEKTGRKGETAGSE